ncbi:ImmA/IrrE family metallo-endopeptidase [candidate division KSB1 bacterium]|nr:ImmA/IrrE family metallo-endopeptidase [candidate division KSB1 bacterium]
MDQRYYRRLRFTIAHEIGHLVLHREEIEKCQFRTEADWIRFREDMSEDDLFWFEQQAYEFAGRLLVPMPQLMNKLKVHRDKIRTFRDMTESDDDELLIKAISRIVCDKFDVSESVISRRIKNEKMWDELNL